jgi:hypothetical protein
MMSLAIAPAIRPKIAQPMIEPIIFLLVDLDKSTPPS